MEQLAIPRALVEEILVALNEVRNTSFGGTRYKTTYELAAELSRTMKVGRERT